MGESSALLRRELDYLDEAEKQKLLQQAGIVCKIGPQDALAIKADLGVPWAKLRYLRRWLKASGVAISCEESMRDIAREVIGDNLNGEMAPFSFPAYDGGEEVRAAPHVFIPNLNQKIIQLLEENDSTGQLTWHEGIIPKSEVWIKLGGDKGGDVLNTFKMNFQIVNVAAPNSVHNTCVFSCFEAADSITNLHCALDRFRSQIDHLQEMKWRQYSFKVFMSGDYEYLTTIHGLSGASGKCPCLFCEINHDQMQLAITTRGRYPERTLESILAHYRSFMADGGIRKKAMQYCNCISEPLFNIPLLQSTTSSFTDYCIELQKLQLMKAECAEAQDSLRGLEEVTTYVAICLGEKDPISADYIKQVKEKRQSVKAMESEINHATKVVEKGFKIQDGPFCAGLDNALQSFNVKRQQYFGGVFVGNHIHKTLMVNKLCMYSWL
ncbi:hypothetical protein EMCRGX_G032527 [Ephydatia muelleri]